MYSLEVALRQQKGLLALRSTFKLCTISKSEEWDVNHRGCSQWEAKAFALHARVRYTRACIDFKTLHEAELTEITDKSSKLQFDSNIEAVNAKYTEFSDIDLEQILEAYKKDWISSKTLCDYTDGLIGLMKSEYILHGADSITTLCDESFMKPLLLKVSFELKSEWFTK